VVGPIGGEHAAQQVDQVVEITAQQEEGDQVRVQVAATGGAFVAVGETLENLAGEEGEIAFAGRQRGGVPVDHPQPAAAVGQQVVVDQVAVAQHPLTRLGAGDLPERVHPFLHAEQGRALRPHQRLRLGAQLVGAAGTGRERGQAGAQPVGPDLEGLHERDRHRQRRGGRVDGGDQAGELAGHRGGAHVLGAERPAVDELEHDHAHPIQPAPRLARLRRSWAGHGQPQVGEGAAQLQREPGLRGLGGGWPAQLEEPPAAALVGQLVAPGRRVGGNRSVVVARP
jgi:hypothetical protein